MLKLKMTGKTAGMIFISVCILLAILLLTQVISPLVSGIIFASALVLFGGFSKGFRKI
jgi:hypothetical protein